MTKRVCVVVNGRANYGRIKSFMRAVVAHPELELQLIVGASALLNRFGNVIDIIKQDGFSPDATVYSIVEGENPTTMAKSTGLGIVELATHFETLKPNVVLTVADRFETLATAVASSYMNIPLAHTQGGDVTGSIDESVRHAVTKLAHIHFPASKRAAEFLVRMGENKATVHLVGCPSIDLLRSIDLSMYPKELASAGVGAKIDENKPYIIVLQHPVTTEYGSGLAQINQTIKAVSKLESESIQVFWLWPNVDAGSDDISKGLRVFRENSSPDFIRFYRNFSPEDYARLLNNAACIVGNSSSALREGGYLGVPAVNIGNRQMGRERANNVLDVPYDADQIYKAIMNQLDQGRYNPSLLLGDGTAGIQMADILARESIVVQKRLSY